MSCTNWESGTIVIPRPLWPAFKADLRTAYNTLQEQKFAMAKRWHAELCRQAEGTRNFHWQEALTKLIQNDRNTGVHDTYDIQNTLLPTTGKTALGSAGKPKTPQAQAFKKATGATLCFRFDEASITLNNNEHSVHWNTGENNHAVDHAHDHPMGQALFRLLDRIIWVRNSGGELIGNDEYNQDSRHEGGGANYVTRRYGPKTKADIRAEAEQARYVSASMGRFRTGSRW